jgi:hypothetical protein
MLSEQNPALLSAWRKQLHENGWLEEADNLRAQTNSYSLKVRDKETTGNFLALNLLGERLVIFLPRQSDAPCDSPQSLYLRFLDMDLERRLCLWAARHVLGADHVACADTAGVALFRAHDEERLAFIAPEDCETAGSAISLALTSPTAEETPALPDRDKQGAELAKWADLFCGALGPALKWSRSETMRLIRQILVGFKTVLWPEGSALDALGAIGFESERNGDGLHIRYSPVPAPEFARLLLTRAETWAPRGTGFMGALEVNGLSRQLASIDPARAEALHDLLQLARFRHLGETQSALLAPRDEHKHASRLALVEPLAVWEEMDFHDLYVYKPLVLSLEECGAGRVLEAVRGLAPHAARQAAELRRAGGRQMDMIEDVLRGNHPVEARSFQEPLNWVFRHALRVRAPFAQREPFACLLASAALELRGHPELRDWPTASLTDLPLVFS